MRIVVTGLVGSVPLAGLTFHYVQYILGLKSLSHEVLYLEDTGTWNYDPETDSMVSDCTRNVAYLASVMDSFGVPDQWTYIDHTGQQFGLTGRRMTEYLDSADLLINVTGAGIMRDEYMRIPRRAYIDTDPAFIQFRVAAGNEKDQAHLSAHTSLFSFGVNIGDESCSIPSSGLTWLPTVQPIDLSIWPQKTGPPAGAPFTTIMKWKSYDPVVFEGREYGLKDRELEHFLDLTLKCSVPLEIAIAGNVPDTLNHLGWRTRNALDVSSSPDRYRDYIVSSAGEWSVAKEAYVATGSGWFSERSACYMACERPVILQETGFSRWLQADRGIMSFRTLDEAVAALESVSVAPDAHRRAAREVAHEFFSAERVLRKLLEAATN